MIVKSPSIVRGFLSLTLSLRRGTIFSRHQLPPPSTRLSIRPWPPSHDRTDGCDPSFLPPDPLYNDAEKSPKLGRHSLADRLRRDRLLHAMKRKLAPPRATECESELRAPRTDRQTDRLTTVRSQNSIAAPLRVLQTVPTFWLSSRRCHLSLRLTWQTQF